MSAVGEARLNHDFPETVDITPFVANLDGGKAIAEAQDILEQGLDYHLATRVHETVLASSANLEERLLCFKEVISRVLNPPIAPNIVVHGGLVVRRGLTE